MDGLQLLNGTCYKLGWLVPIYLLSVVPHMLLAGLRGRAELRVCCIAVFSREGGSKPPFPFSLR